jgi:hypothetical protein
VWRAAAAPACRRTRYQRSVECAPCRGTPFRAGSCAAYTHKRTVVRSELNSKPPGETLPDSHASRVRTFCHVGERRSEVFGPAHKLVVASSGRGGVTHATDFSRAAQVGSRDRHGVCVRGWERRQSGWRGQCRCQWRRWLSVGGLGTVLRGLRRVVLKEQVDANAMLNSPASDPCAPAECWLVSPASATLRPTTGRAAGPCCTSAHP